MQKDRIDLHDDNTGGWIDTRAQNKQMSFVVWQNGIDLKCEIRIIEHFVLAKCLFMSPCVC